MKEGGMRRVCIYDLEKRENRINALFGGLFQIKSNTIGREADIKRGKHGKRVSEKQGSCIYILVQRLISNQNS